ncbi:hypothetical protein H1230_20625 [Paenibacillus sp. 19GGS1-52]|uniref:hypothetical protein n=1 Tax=Paenibacillus sp. 19GGS1-52 TaxID=2758563 RepID=UPI001EFBF62E|nr:hypothetical protein [Paenibacillus sp. 19GGS1-52]ULO05475.1 hypothetical protein H1230_20625 [Paenibacillus sp. 19GGS1-52]
MYLSEFANEYSENFEVLRNGKIISVTKGVISHSKGKKIIQFSLDTDVFCGDWIVSRLSNKRFYIDDVISRKNFNNRPRSKVVYYSTEIEHEAKTTLLTSAPLMLTDQDSHIRAQPDSTLFTNVSDEQIEDYIENNCGEDKELMRGLLRSINAVIENNIPVQKGSFSVFSEISPKYAWLLGILTTKLLVHFFSNTITPDIKPIMPSSEASPITN